MNNDTQKQTIELSKKTILYIIGGVVLLVGALLVWKTVQVKNVRTEFSKREDSLVQRMNNGYSVAQKNFLKLMAKSYVWAVRKEMLSGNLEQVEQYGNEMVKEQNFVYIMVADPGGKILTSTDQKYQGKNLGTLVKNPAVFNTDSTILLPSGDSLMALAAPVMGLDKKIGTVFMKYIPVRFSPNGP